MIDDIIIIKNFHRKKAKLITDKIISLPDRSVIGIQGVSGLGKTEISSLIRDLLYRKNRKSIIISLDDYYKEHWSIRNRTRKQKGIKTIGIKEIDWNLIKKIIKDFKKNKPELKTQQISKCADTFFDCIVNQADKLHYLIIEGLFSGYLKKFKLLDYCIHLEGNPKQTLKFRKERMKKKKKKKKRKKIVQKEANVVAQLKRYANLIVPFEI